MKTHKYGDKTLIGVPTGEVALMPTTIGYCTHCEFNHPGKHTHDPHCTRSASEKNGAPRDCRRVVWIEQSKYVTIRLEGSP